ncbi:MULTISPECIES: PTS system mannose/fructose/N-acetylgalactosamine-transporter subunit IIB [Atopobiaceae]|uniref:PTS system, mannose-specific IIB component n=1 Tax=Parafannyhessea umbonata TaxID=604330 RepID=A0A1H9QV04_9ACTN|nr:MULTISPECIES: PTS sugar transporter subunit IIB [Atopobiaceae]SEH44721.1 PTS system, mannose-specific IIB component [Parafannyhessea umbonata]SER64055.1 PTS system, mannose-specific IIB component [Parafannyhessea umbonata]SJZ60784.1 PTS system, mannose-specific IIB component [Olsenella sp. KH1P3]
MIALVRCDDRLIHGQTMTVVVKLNHIERIIVVDNLTATNPVLKKVFETAVPASMKAGAYTVSEAVPLIEAALANDERTLVLMKTPEVYRDLLEKVADMPLELNVGPMSKRKDTTEVHAAAHLTASEAQAVKEAVAKGAHVYFQQIPSQPKVEWADVADRF